MKGEEGQALVLLAVVFTVLIALAGIAIDYVHVIVVKEDLQNAVDLAALAGADELRDGGTLETVKSVAKKIGYRNGAGDCTVTVVGLQVTVEGHQDVPAVFAPIVGIESFSVSASGVAAVVPYVAPTLTPSFLPTPTLQYTPTPTPTAVVRLVQ